MSKVFSPWDLLQVAAHSLDFISRQLHSLCQNFLFACGALREKHSDYLTSKNTRPPHPFISEGWHLATPPSSASS